MSNKVKRSILPVLTLSIATLVGSQFAIATPASAVTPTVKSVISGGYHVLAVKTDGTVWAWGDNAAYQLGNGTTTDNATAAQVKTSGTTLLTGVTAVASKQYHSLALKSDGTVWAWGHNAHGQLGTGNTLNQAFATPVLDATGQPIDDVIAIATGGTHSIALKSDGTVWAWGSNLEGQLGVTSTTSSTTAIHVAALDTASIESVYAGLRYTYAVNSLGEVYAWGENNYGQLGDGTTTNRSTPQVVDLNGIEPGTDNVIDLSTGYNHVLALKADNTVSAWGYNSLGQLGFTAPTGRTTPGQVAGLSNVTKLIEGGYHHFSLALDSNKNVWGFGDNRYSQLGVRNTALASHTPAALAGISNARSFTGGTSYSIILKWDGSLWGLGDNTQGVFGSTTISSTSTPVQIPAF